MAKLPFITASLIYIPHTHTHIHTHTIETLAMNSRQSRQTDK